MLSERLRWTLRTALMFIIGVVPAIVLFVFILVVMPLAAILPGVEQLLIGLRRRSAESTSHP
jgi:hypothetical protein